MEGKTKVILKADHQYNEWEAMDEGYIDGYVRGGNDTPLAAVVLNQKIVLVPIHVIKVIL